VGATFGLFAGESTLTVCQQWLDVSLPSYSQHKKMQSFLNLIEASNAALQLST
jgi:hypothetical protein